MSCAQCLDKLTDFIEGDLSPADEARVRSHLDTCPDCARELARMRALVGAVRGLPEAEPPAELRERLRRIPEVTAPASRSWWSRSRRVAVAVTAAAAGLLLVWTGTLFYQQETGGVGDTMVAEPSVAMRAEAPEADQPVTRETPEIADEADAASGAPSPDDFADTEADAPAPEPSPAAEAPAPVADLQPAPPPSAREPRPRAPRRTQPAPTAEQPSEPAPREAPPMRPPAPEPRSHRVPAGPEGPRGPAAGAAPGADTMIAETDDAAAEPRMLTVEPPAWLDAGKGASARIGEGTPFTVGVAPPHEKITGTVVPATIRIETEADVSRARINVSGSEHLELVNVGDDGVVFEGPLKAGQQTVLSVRMMARKPGTQSITMRVRSTDPVVDTRLNVRMGDFAEPVPPGERPVQFDFVGTPIREAVGEITRQSGMSVIVDPGVGEATVTARADDPVPATAALRLVAEAAGLQVTEADGRSIVRGVDEEQ